MVADHTRGLSQGGTLRLELPRRTADIGLPVADPDLAGAGDFPPALDDERQAKLVCWLRVARRNLGHSHRHPACLRPHHG